MTESKRQRLEEIVNQFCSNNGFISGENKQWLITELEAALEREARLVEVCEKLIKESSAIISAHEYAIRQDAGNTNYECYLLRLNALDKALEAHKKVKG
jgi:hypothetical protein